MPSLIEETIAELGDSDQPLLSSKLAAIRALGKIGSAEAKNCLEQCLDSPSEAIQLAAEQALYELEIGGEPLSY